MTIANRKKRVYYPKASQRLQEIEDTFIQILYENEINERIRFPITSDLSVFDTYPDNKKEYLVDFATADDKVTVFNPEYFTVIRDYNLKYLNDQPDQLFYYVQEALSYCTIERKDVKEDLVLGYCILNSKNVLDHWALVCKVFTAMARELDKSVSIVFNNNATLEASLDGIMVGFAKNDSGNGIMEAHFSLTDIYTVLNKRK